MDILSIIEKKRDKKILSEDEIHYFINQYIMGHILDYQASSLLMAICINGFTDEETFALTKAMLQSGDTIDLSPLNGIKVDKHSTGGVGDKTSLIIGPMVAACGLIFAKMSGRALSFTGGTIDKLESIDGFQVEKSKHEFLKQLDKIHLAIIAQSDSLVPADKKLYALRDVSGSVPSIPLIASSIMSKKLAVGTNMILLDVKYGDGAFMQTKEEAMQLAKLMIRIGTAFQRQVKAEITSMEQPLGYAIGNSLEVAEAIQVLQGSGPDDLRNLCLHSVGVILMMANRCKSIEEGKAIAKKTLIDHSAYYKFKEMVIHQGGNEDDLKSMLSQLTHPKTRYSYSCQSEQTGYVKKIHTKKLGLIACQLGAGRTKKNDPIDPYAGILLKVKCNDKVPFGKVLCRVDSNKIIDDSIMEEIRNCFEIDHERSSIPSLIEALV